MVRASESRVGLKAQCKADGLLLVGLLVYPIRRGNVCDLAGGLSCKKYPTKGLQWLSAGGAKGGVLATSRPDKKGLLADEARAYMVFKSEQE